MILVPELYHCDYSDYVPLQKDLYFNVFFLLYTVFSFYVAAIPASFKRARLKKDARSLFRFSVPLLFFLFRNNGTMHSAYSCRSEFLYAISSRDVTDTLRLLCRLLCSRVYRQRFTPGV